MMREKVGEWRECASSRLKSSLDALDGVGVGDYVGVGVGVSGGWVIVLALVLVSVLLVIVLVIVLAFVWGEVYDPGEMRSSVVYADTLTRETARTHTS